MLHFSRTRTVIAVASFAGFFCFAGAAWAEQIKLSDPWKEYEVIETDDFEIDELEQIRGIQRDPDVERQMREVLLERAAAEPLLLRGEAEPQPHP